MFISPVDIFFCHWIGEWIAFIYSDFLIEHMFWIFVRIASISNCRSTVTSWAKSCDIQFIYKEFNHWIECQYKDGWLFIVERSCIWSRKWLISGCGSLISLFCPHQKYNIHVWLFIVERSCIWSRKWLISGCGSLKTLFCPHQKYNIHVF